MDQEGPPGVEGLRSPCRAPWFHAAPWVSPIRRATWLAPEPALGFEALPLLFSVWARCRDAGLLPLANGLKGDPGLSGNLGRGKGKVEVAGGAWPAGEHGVGDVK